MKKGKSKKKVKNAQSNMKLKAQRRVLDQKVAAETKATVCDEDHPWFSYFVRYRMHCPNGKIDKDFYTWAATNPDLLE